MKLFLINDDVQLIIEQNIKDCKGFYFITCDEKKKESDACNKYIWLLRTGNANVLRNFIELVREKYGEDEKFIKKRIRINKEHINVYLVLKK